MSLQDTAVQDRYLDRFAHCFGCGRLHPTGFQVKTYFDPETGVGIMHFTPAALYTGGWPEVMYGGVIASLIDCNTGATASATKAIELGIADDAPLPRYVTASIKVDLHKPTPAGAALELRSKVRSLDGRKAWVDTKVSYDGVVTCTGEALMILAKDDPEL